MKIGFRLCLKCRQFKGLHLFYKDKNNLFGVFIYCKECDNARHQRYRKNHPDMMKDKHLQQRFGMSVASREMMLDSQDRKCRICGSPDPGSKSWHIDHDHRCCLGRKSCGKCIRGLLCISCNKGLGDFKDNPIFLANAIDYLNGRAMAA